MAPCGPPAGDTYLNSQSLQIVMSSPILDMMNVVISRLTRLNYSWSPSFHTTPWYQQEKYNVLCSISQYCLPQYIFLVPLRGPKVPKFNTVKTQKSIESYFSFGYISLAVTNQCSYILRATFESNTKSFFSGLHCKFYINITYVTLIFINVGRIFKG